MPELAQTTSHFRDYNRFICRAVPGYNVDQLHMRHRLRMSATIRRMWEALMGFRPWPVWADDRGRTEILVAEICGLGGDRDQIEQAIRELIPIHDNRQAPTPSGEGLTLSGVWATMRPATPRISRFRIPDEIRRPARPESRNSDPNWEPCET